MQGETCLSNHARSVSRNLASLTFDHHRDCKAQAEQLRPFSVGGRSFFQVPVAEFICKCQQAPEPSAELFAESEQLHERAVENLTAALQQARVVEYVIMMYHLVVWGDVPSPRQGHPLTLASLHNQACSWIDRCFHEEGSLTGPNAKWSSSLMHARFSRLRLQPCIVGRKACRHGRGTATWQSLQVRKCCANAFLLFSLFHQQAPLSAQAAD